MVADTSSAYIRLQTIRYIYEEPKYESQTTDLKKTPSHNTDLNLGTFLDFLYTVHSPH